MEDAEERRPPNTPEAHGELNEATREKSRRFMSRVDQAIRLRSVRQRKFVSPEKTASRAPTQGMLFPIRDEQLDLDFGVHGVAEK